MLATLAMLMAFGSNLSAQTVSKGDTLLIGPLNSEGQPLGALNQALLGDTTATGERKHKVYKLQRGAQYILTEIINIDFPLVLVADNPDAQNRPPIIRNGVDSEGASIPLWWRLMDNATFKNLWLSGINLAGNGPIAWISQEATGTKKSFRYEGCIFEFPYTWWAMFADFGGNNRYYFDDCIFMNIGNPTGATWNGAIFHAAVIDSLVVKNTTFYNFGCFALNSGDGTYYMEADHCTFVNSTVHPMNNHKGIKQIITNNLFVNTHAFSDDIDEIKRHFDQEVKGIINYAEIQWDPVRLDTLYGPGKFFGKNYDPNGDGKLTPDELVFELRNNAWWYTQPVVDYWNQFPEVVANPWMNNYNKAMFTNKEADWEWKVWTYTWPVDTAGKPVYTNGPLDSTQVTMNHKPFQFFVEENTKNVNPGLININGTDALLAKNSINIRKEWANETVPDEDKVRFHGIPAGDGNGSYLDFASRWPLNFNLGYTNTELLTASTRGGPIGSLQWFPDWVPTSTSDPLAANMAFGLSQNYPNPFSHTTTINYSVSKESMIDIDIYNSLGARVATLVNENKQPGNYSVTFDGTSLSDGIYYLRMKSGNQVVSKKMMLMK
jgi:hypothetical protein